nr:hypothetical protein CFP56_17419 [Quercus suber]
MVSLSSQEREGDGLEPRELCFPKGRISEPTQVFLDQEFQAQLVDIDKELTKFDGKDKEGEESAAKRPCTTNSRVLESAIPTWFCGLRIYRAGLLMAWEMVGVLIWERLDRGVANYEWLARFPTDRVKHLNCFTSNHQPILFSLAANGEQQRWRQKPFRFEAMWTSNSACREVISRAWDCTTKGTPMFKATRKLQRCKKSLKDWNRDHFGNV